MKKFCIFALVLIMLLSASAPALAAESYTGTVSPEAVMLLNSETGDILFEKNASVKVYPASTTKILTALLLLKNAEDLDAVVMVSNSALEGIVYGSDSTLSPMLSAGESITVRQLLYGILLASGNDAAAVAAEYVSGSVDKFVELMNSTAAELGMTSSHFSNPHGIHSEDHYTTCADMAKLTAEALKNETFMQAVSASTYTIPATNLSGERVLENTNLLLSPQSEYYYEYATGIKTGSTPYSNGCLVASAEKDGIGLICLIFNDGTEDRSDRWPLAKSLFDYGFSCYKAYTWAELFSAVSLPEQADDGTKYTVTADLSSQNTITLPSDFDISSITARLSPPEAGGSDGHVSYFAADGTFLASANAVFVKAASSGGSGLTVVVKILLAIVAVVLAALLICAAALTALRVINTGKHMVKSKRRTEKPSVLYIIQHDRTTWALIAVVLVSLLLFILTTSRCGKVGSGKAPESNGRDAANAADSSDADDESANSSTPQIPGSGITGIGRSVIRPEMTASSNPANWGIKWDIIENDKIVDSYSRSEKISFGNPEDYFALPGISAFRGDNYRSTATYGTASVTEKTISAEWYSSTGALVNGWGTSSWTGSGWTGQPLIVQWDAETRQIMNLNSEKKSKDGLVEVIYATLDGHIYFLDLDDGQYTREPINVGMTFKGAGTIDPRGYPLLYVGSGDTTVDGKRPRMFIISLIDGSVLYELGYDDAYALREDNDKWCGFDSSPLVDGKTDTLIWPGENGILYTIKLNTAYDKSAGTVSVKPGDIVKTRYLPERASADKYWLGYEDSVSVIGSYMYLSENGGLFHCIDLNTMELIWTQDTKDDSNSTPPVEYDEKSGKYYLYTAPSLHWTANDDGSGSISIFKLDAENGDIIWEKAYPCHTVSGASGGVQASPVLGKAGTNIEGLIIYPIARTPNEYDGILAALDTQTGEEVWRLSMSNYAWSSPVAVYSDDGSAYLVLCDSGGTAFLIDGKTGEVLDSVSVEWLVEASPAVYNDTVVVGTRGQRIYALKVK